MNKLVNLGFAAVLAGGLAFFAAPQAHADGIWHDGWCHKDEGLAFVVDLTNKPHDQWPAYAPDGIIIRCIINPEQNLDQSLPHYERVMAAVGLPYQVNSGHIAPFPGEVKPGWYYGSGNVTDGWNRVWDMHSCMTTNCAQAFWDLGQLWGPAVVPQYLPDVVPAPPDDPAWNPGADVKPPAESSNPGTGNNDHFDESAWQDNSWVDGPAGNQANRPAGQASGRPRAQASGRLSASQPASPSASPRASQSPSPSVSPSSSPSVEEQVFGGERREEANPTEPKKSENNTVGYIAAGVVGGAAVIGGGAWAFTKFRPKA